MGAFSGERVLHFGCCPILTGNNNNHWHPRPSAAASCRLQRAFLKYQLSSAHDKIKHFLFRKKNQVCISFIQRGAETVVTGLGSCTLVHLPAGRSAGDKTTQRNNDRPLPSNGTACLRSIPFSASCSCVCRRYGCPPSIVYLD